MRTIGSFLANTYGLFIVVAIFAILALIGYIVESKTGFKKRTIISSTKTEDDIDSNLQKLKNDLSNNNKGLGNMVGTFDSQTSFLDNKSSNVINFNQNNSNDSVVNTPDKL